MDNFPKENVYYMYLFKYLALQERRNLCGFQITDGISKSF